jgi:hypothetical protein
MSRFVIIKHEVYGVRGRTDKKEFENGKVN